MMRNQSFLLRPLVILLLAAWLLPACRDTLDIENRYRNALAAGIGSNDRTNELLSGFELGMSQQDFYSQLTKLGKAQAVDVTKSGIALDFPLPELPGESSISFQPFFEGGAKQNVLAALDFSINYAATSDEQADNNISTQRAFSRAVTNKFRLDFKEAEFFALPDDDYFRVIVQVANNRRLAFFRKNRYQVIGRFTDLTVLPKDPLVVENFRSVPKE